MDPASTFGRGHRKSQSTSDVGKHKTPAKLRRSTQTKDRERELRDEPPASVEAALEDVSCMHMV